MLFWNLYVSVLWSGWGRGRLLTWQPCCGQSKRELKSSTALYLLIGFMDRYLASGFCFRRRRPASGIGEILETRTQSGRKMFAYTLTIAEVY